MLFHCVRQGLTGFSRKSFVSILLSWFRVLITQHFRLISFTVTIILGTENLEQRSTVPKINWHDKSVCHKLFVFSVYKQFVFHVLFRRNAHSEPYCTTCQVLCQEYIDFGTAQISQKLPFLSFKRCFLLYCVYTVPIYININRYIVKYRVYVKEVYDIY